MSWHLKEKLQHILAQESGTTIFAPGARNRFAFVYPNTYHVGMSNLGLHIIYQQINSRGDTACERVFLPEKKIEQEYVRTNTPLMSIENQLPLYEFPLIGFALSFEMDYFNMLTILKLGKVTLLSSERSADDPIIIAGGPCATFNPEPIADFIDVFVIGEGEEVIHDLLTTYYNCKRQGMTREQLLLMLANIAGLYVPRFYQPVYNDNGSLQEMRLLTNVPKKIRRRWVADLDQYQAHSVIVTSHTEFKNMFLIEVARGCGRHCRFCMAGYCFREPRVHSLANIEQAILKAKKYRAKVGLMGAAISDYPEIDKLCTLILDHGMGLSVASLRADSLTQGLVDGLVKSGQKTITLAPEAGSIRMRRVINKTITDEDIFNSVEMAIKAGIPNIRLYIMVGLPFEEQQDIEAILSMADKIKAHMEKLGSKGKLTLSVNPFIPKPFTPFQWMPMAPAADVEAKFKYLAAHFKIRKGMELLLESTKESYIQGVLARGDRRLSPVLLEAHNNGGSKAFKKSMKSHSLQENFYLSGNRETDELLPWQHLDMAFHPDYLIHELDKAHQEIFTLPCVKGCTRCGICQPIPKEEP
ncbi:MAG: TIGR03960 family B12-binding radical SAM protein [Negativicutes bacterium]|nr:TIGR03960 family B12-binding radical SAM protein [Negativicutes bacterium]